LSLWQRRLVLSMGVLWTLPNSLLGLIAGICAIPFGARPKLRKRDLALVFHGFPMGPGGAMTLGNVMLSTHSNMDSLCTTYAHRAGWCVQPETRIGDHERAHVLQYMALGPLFLPLYFLFGGVSVRNRFERAADRYALTGRDWWPWLKANSKAEILRLGETIAR
jgi:hypothetical protein